MCRLADPNRPPVRRATRCTQQPHLQPHLQPHQQLRLKQRMSPCIPDQTPVRASLIALALCLTVAGCAGPRRPAGDDAPTLKSLASRKVEVTPDRGVKADENRAIAAYKAFLDAAPNDRGRAEAMRRLGDLEMDAADNKSAEGGVSEPSAAAVTAAARAAAGGDYRAAIARYHDFLKTYPNDPGNDRVLYQLARAHEQSGNLEQSLKTLDQLVQQFPATRFRDEAQFRRGELLFTTRDYVNAEKAYATVLSSKKDTPFQERSLYMQGWSLFKQGRLDDALHPFFGVLDRKLVGRGDAPLERIEGLTRADRELVEDTFRVSSLSLANLQSAETIPTYITSDARREYEFRVYEQLGELYIKQQRVKDAADTFAAFARLNPLHAQAPLLQARVIDIYQQGGFATLALDAKKAYVSNYGVSSAFRKANPAGWEKAQPLVKAHLTELATTYHAAAQKSRKSEDYQEAVRWYRVYLSSFPKDPQAAQNNFLLAELLFEDKRFEDAGIEYEKTAYGYPAHAKSADAGYAALLALAEREKALPVDQQAAVAREGVASALRFGGAFGKDPRNGLVLSNAASRLYALGDGAQAAEVAQQVMALNPPAATPQRRVAATVLAHTAFERGAFDVAEQRYTEVLSLSAEADPARKDLTERLAAAIYKQGEAARADGRMADAVALFARVGVAAPLSTVRAAAQFDAAAAQIVMKDWDSAVRTLEDFRGRFTGHPLQPEVGPKLAVAYMEKGRWAQAAAEFERMATTQKDPVLARESLWQAAQLHEKAGANKLAVATYERYLKQYREPLQNAVEARFRLASIARQDGDAKRTLQFMKEVFAADQGGGAARNERTRYLGANAALALAEPVREDYAKVALVEPLKRQLVLKKKKLEDTLKAYALAADYGVADVATAATFQTADLYRDFGVALMKSQRPKMSKAETEQYNVMLEEQAYPFEEKAMALHEVNVQRSAKGIYDPWVKRSYAALAELRPVRYGKTERGDTGALTPEALAQLEQQVGVGAAEPRGTQAGAVNVAALNRLAIAYRHAGQFDQARVIYERALASSPEDPTTLLNLAILRDLYLWDAEGALALYERYLGASADPKDNDRVKKWVADLKNRRPQAAGAGAGAGAGAASATPAPATAVPATPSPAAVPAAPATPAANAAVPTAAVKPTSTAKPGSAAKPATASASGAANQPAAPAKPAAGSKEPR